MRPVLLVGRPYGNQSDPKRHTIDVAANAIDLGFEAFKAHLKLLGPFVCHVPAHHKFIGEVSFDKTRTGSLDETGDTRDDSSEYPSKGARTLNKIQPGGDSRDRENAQRRLQDAY